MRGNRAAAPRAVSLSGAEDCVLEDLVIKGVAGHAVNGDGLRNVRVENCDIADCGAGGVYVGGARVVIRSNHVRQVGRSYPSAIGIYRGGSECLVSHNEVHDCTYSAINYGGRSNIIEGNLIYDCMKVLHDGAAIYVFGARNTVLRGNLARDFADSGGYGASAYYLDEQCSGCVVEGNVSLRVNWPSQNHMATNNIIRDNLFVVGGDAKIAFARSTGYTFARNVFYATGKIRFEGTNAVATWTDNLLYSGKGRFECTTLNQNSEVGTVTNAPQLDGGRPGICGSRARRFPLPPRFARIEAGAAAGGCLDSGTAAEIARQSQNHSVGRPGRECDICSLTQPRLWPRQLSCANFQGGAAGTCLLTHPRPVLYSPPMSREAQLSQFAAWVRHNITGDEKGQAQIFLDRLFQAFGQPGVLDVGGQIEFRLRKAAEDGGGTAFADLDAPKDKLGLTDLTQRLGPFAFLARFNRLALPAPKRSSSECYMTGR